MVHHDVCVLGGGPAGSAFAILMARRGARVALLEKTAFAAPRCGEHLPPRARGALRTLGCKPRLLSEIAVASPGILTRWSTHAPIFKRYAGHADGTGLNLTRHRFDAALFNQAQVAGAITHTGATLAHAEHLNGAWELSFRVHAEAGRGASTDDEISARRSAQSHDGSVTLCLRADRVVDGTGRAAVFARRQRATWHSFGNLVAAVGRLRALHAGVPDDCCLFVDACPEGWWSVTPVRREVIATFYASADAKRSAGLNPHRWWQWGLDAAPGVRERIGRSASALEDLRMHAAFPRVLRKMYGTDWFAIGDAAAAHDPLSGHGILYALESAFRAAEMACADLPLERSGAIYQEAIVGRFARHIENRTLAYHEAAATFPDSPFWREIAASCEPTSA